MLTLPNAKLATAGPGQIPAKPQPKPKIAAPDNKRPSMFLLVGVQNASPLTDCFLGLMIKKIAWHEYRECAAHHKSQTWVPTARNI